MADLFKDTSGDVGCWSCLHFVVNHRGVFLTIQLFQVIGFFWKLMKNSAPNRW